MSHYARTIHSSFSSGIGHSWASSSSSSPYATSASSAHANLLLGGYIHNKYPPGLGHSTTDWRAPGSGSGYRRRAAVPARSPPPPVRRAVPPSPPRIMKFDPFADDFGSDDDFSSPSLTISPRLPAPASGSRPRSGSFVSSGPGAPMAYRSARMGTTRPASLALQTRSSAPYTIKLEPAPPPAPPVLDRDARSRLVAGILLNRVHAVGKPMRGARCREPREYVKSGLSSVVSLEA